MIREIDVLTLKSLLDAGERVHLVDVREPWEHDIAHLPGSQLVPLRELHEHAEEVAPPPGTLVVAYCHHGVRSLEAAWLLEQQGLDVVSLAGGIDRWSRQIDPSVPRY